MKVVVPFGAGGPPDLVARVLADPLAKELNGTVVVDNRPGAGGTTGVTGVARAEPDGYTLLIATSAYIVNKALNDQIAYDPIGDFTPICEIANAPNVFVVNANLGINSLKEFVAFAKSQPKGVQLFQPGPWHDAATVLRTAARARQHRHGTRSLQQRSAGGPSFADQSGATVLLRHSRLCSRTSMQER